MRSIIAVVVAVGCALIAAAGWGTGGSQEQANRIALAHCTAEAGDVCEVVAGTRNGCASVAFDRSGRFQGGSGPDTTASNADALAKLGAPNGRIKASHCSS